MLQKGSVELPRGSIQDGPWCGSRLEERLQFSKFQKVEERSTTLPAGVAGATWPPQSLHSGAEPEAAQRGRWLM